MYDLSIINNEINTKKLGKAIIQYDNLESIVRKAKKVFDSCPSGTVILLEQELHKICFSTILKELYVSSDIPKLNNLVIDSLHESLTNNCQYDLNIQFPNLILNDKIISSISIEKVGNTKNPKGLLIVLDVDLSLSSEIEKDRCNIREKIISNFLNILEDRFLIDLNINETYKELGDINI